MSVELSACARCGHAYFPPRRICHRCGGSAWAAITASHGILEEATTLLHQVGAVASPNTVLGAVRTEAGPVVLARLTERAAPNTRVRLTQAPSGAVIGEIDPELGFGQSGGSV